MTEFAPERSDDLVAEVVTRRFAADPRDAAVAAIVRDLARAVREDHVALDLATHAGATRVLTTLRREARLCEFLGPVDVPALDGPPLMVVDDRYLYLRRLAVAERRVAQVLASARAAEVAPPRGLRGDAIDQAARELTEELAARGTPSPELAEVARRCLNRRVSFVVGGPGTGKTWLVTQVLRLVDRAVEIGGDGQVLTFAVAAPTGKAARRVGETIDQVTAGNPFAHLVRDVEREGSLHRLLGARPGARADVAPLYHDLIIVDEVSMADLPLLDLLLRATSGEGEHAPRVVLVGDPHQLASVNVGAVLADAVASEARDDALVSRLSVVHRTGHRPLLDLAAAVNAGDVNSVTALLERGDVEHRGDVEDADAVRATLAHADDVADLAAAGDAVGALAALRRHCVLSATAKGPGSVAWWNARVGVHHRRRHPPVAGERFSVGEPVLVTRNQRSLNVSNGDLGVIVEQSGRRVVAFEGDRVMPVGGVGFLETAWAMTIHKSQGSEFAHVVVVLPRAESPLLTRELLYTAVTRATDGVTLLGASEAVARAVATPISRVSGLTHRLAHWPDVAGGRAPGQ